MPKILGIDPGMMLGIAQGFKGKKESVDAYAVDIAQRANKEHGEADFEDRIEEVRNIIGCYTGGIRLAVIERPVVSIGRSTDASIRQGEMLRVIKDTLTNNGVPWVEVNNAEVKRALRLDAFNGEKRRMDKNAMVEGVTKLYGDGVFEDHRSKRKMEAIADAIAILRVGEKLLDEGRVSLC